MVIKKDKCLIKSSERLAKGSLTMNYSNVVLTIIFSIKIDIKSNVIRV